MATLQVSAALLSQLRQQREAIQQRRAVNPFIVGIYTSRDDRTPTRKFVSASGGVYYTQKISNSAPQSTPPVIIRGRVGAVGIYDQR